MTCGFKQPCHRYPECGCRWPEDFEMEQQCADPGLWGLSQAIATILLATGLRWTLGAVRWTVRRGRIWWIGGGKVVHLRRWA